MATLPCERERERNRVTDATEMEGHAIETLHRERENEWEAAPSPFAREREAPSQLVERERERGPYAMRECEVAPSPSLTAHGAYLCP